MNKRNVIKNILCIAGLIILLKSVVFNPNWLTTTDPYIIGFNIISMAIDITILVFLCLKDIDYSSTPTGVTVITTINLKMRREADKYSTMILVIPANRKVFWISDAGNGWSKVRYNGKIGYCNNEYLTGKSGLSSSTPFKYN